MASRQQQELLVRFAPRPAQRDSDLTDQRRRRGRQRVWVVREVGESGD